MAGAAISTEASTCPRFLANLFTAFVSFSILFAVVSCPSCNAVSDVRTDFSKATIKHNYCLDKELYIFKEAADIIMTKLNKLRHG